MIDGLRRRTLLLATLMPTAAQAHATQLRVLVNGAVEHPAHDLGVAFARATGRAVAQDSGNAGQAAARIRAGERFDLAINTGVQVDALIRDGLLDAATRQEVGRIRIGLGVRAGQPAPPLADAEQLRATLLSARSIAYSDGRAGATTGQHIDRMLERFGIAEVIRARVQLHPRGILAAEAVAAGRAELVMTQASEILAVPGVTLAGLLPPTLNLVTPYVGAVVRSSGDPAGAAALLRFLTGVEGVTRFAAAGFTRD